MRTKYPFIYICSTVRTGSTLLGELLTEENKAYIFHEPWFTRGRFLNYQYAFETLSRWGVDTEKLMGMDSTVDILFYLSDLFQLGVKEVRNIRWELYESVFDDIRWLIIVRDPRDVYISRYYYNIRRKYPFRSPSDFFEECLPDIKRQIDVADKPNSMVVKYEDLCINSDAILDVRKFVESPVESEGFVGEFHQLIPRGYYELSVHSNSVTDKVVNRHKMETNTELLGLADEYYLLMKDYNEKWGY